MQIDRAKMQVLAWMGPKRSLKLKSNSLRLQISKTLMSIGKLEICVSWWVLGTSLSF